MGDERTAAAVALLSAGETAKCAEQERPEGALLGGVGRGGARIALGLARHETASETRVTFAKG